MIKAHNATVVLDAFRQVQLKCLQHGHEVEFMRPDAGSVEMSLQVKEKAQEMGITILPAAVEHQEQDLVERYIQTVDNSIAAIMLDHDLLDSSWHDFAAYDAVDGHNAFPCSVTPESSPLYVFEGRNIDLTKDFLYKFGQPGMVPRTKVAKQGICQPRNEFAIVVSSGYRPNGSQLVYLPERKRHFVGARKDFFPILLGPKPTMTQTKGEKHLAVFVDGAWQL